MSKKTARLRLRPLFDSLDRRDVPSSMATGIVDPTPVDSTPSGPAPTPMIRIQPPPGGGSSPTQ